ASARHRTADALEARQACALVRRIPAVTARHETTIEGESLRSNTNGACEEAFRGLLKSGCEARWAAVTLDYPAKNSRCADRSVLPKYSLHQASVRRCDGVLSESAGCVEAHSRNAKW